MKKIFVLYVCFFLIFILGCQQEKPKLTQEQKIAKIMAMQRDMVKEQAVLISLKYSVDKTTMTNLLAEYNTDLIFKFNEPLNDKINNYSGKYKISQKIIASILIDFKSIESKN